MCIRDRYEVGLPFESIAIDIAGPFPVTDDGNRYIMVVGDYFTKWVETYVILNHEVTTVAKELPLWSPYGNPYGSWEIFRIRSV